MREIFFSKIAAISIVVATALGTACSDSTTPEKSAAELQRFPDLPEGTSSPVTLTGKVTDWLFEGDAGCFGASTGGHTSIEVYSGADLCEPMKTDAGATIKVDIIYEQDKPQDIGDGQKPSCTITKFHG
jgi:hypothetical protein